MLSVSHVSKKYGETIALQNASVAIEPGTITAIIGPSGSGKTTLLKTLALLEDPDTGTVEVDGRTFSYPEVNPVEKQGIWPHVTVMFQQLFIWPHLTLRENILLPKGGTLSESDRDYFEKLTRMFQMEDFLDRYPNEASLGQKQRTALVRALFLRPKYLLLDEVTASLDTEQSSIILSHLTEIKNQGIGVVVVAHNIDFAFSLADRVMFLDQGKIVKEGKPYEFLLEAQNQKIVSFIKGAYVGVPNIRFFSGKEQFQAYHVNLINRLLPKSTIYVIGALADTWYQSMGDRLTEYAKVREEKNITWKALMYEFGETDKKFMKKRPDITDFYVLPSSIKNMANINVMSDGTSIIQVFHPEPMIIEIKNQATSEAYLAFFNDLLKSSSRATFD